MFLVSLTKDGIAQNFQSKNVEEFPLHSWKVTIITDTFLSDFISETDGFSVIESPYIHSPDAQKLIFSKVHFESKQNTLNVLRSTISGRPIYYHINPKGEFFCSTHISLLRNAGVVIEENCDVLPEFFVYRFVFAPKTLYKDIFQLRSGDQLQIKIEPDATRVSRIVQYTPPEPTKTEPVDEIVHQTLQHLNDSIRRLEPKKNNISVLFSGGLDSSILFKICQKNYQTDMTFSTCFPFENPDTNIEKEYSSSAATLFNTQHFFLDISSNEYLQGIIEAIAQAEVPIHHLQSVPIYLLFHKIPSTRNIVISGLGADDLFGTSTQYYQFQVERNPLKKFLIKYIQAAHIKYLLSILNADWRNYQMIQENYKKSILPRTDSNHLLWSIGMYGSEEWTLRYFNTTREDLIKNRYTELLKFQDRSLYDMISMLLFLGSASTTQGIWSKLAEKDHKILYCPFTDKSIIDHAFSIPWKTKLKKPKNILRYVAHQVEIPDAIINRQKSGFGVNPELWAQQGGVFESLLPLTRNIFKEKEIRPMQSSNLKNAMIYWNMLNYAIWKRICINNEPIEALTEEIL
jgi:asparagine synthetase B (glutamine-hydrolysing)